MSIRSVAELRLNEVEINYFYWIFGTDFMLRDIQDLSATCANQINYVFFFILNQKT